MHSPVAITCEDVTTPFVKMLNRPILEGINCQIKTGEFVALLGLNGAGKSTLLKALLGLVPLQKGMISIQNTSIATHLHTARQHLGFLPQGGGLVPQLSALDNVLCGNLGALNSWQTLWGFPQRQRRHALDLLTQFGLSDHANQAASKLSGGQQQRVAIARTLTQSTQILLADEPTTGLDIQGTQQVMEILGNLNRDRGMTVVVVLHDLMLVEKYADRAIILDAGRIVYDGECRNIANEFVLIAG